MALYFFDIHDDVLTRDDTGTECADFNEVRRQAKETLPEMARDILPADGDQHSLSVIVRDEHDRTVYTATLTFTGLTLGVPVLD